MVDGRVAVLADDVCVLALKRLAPALCVALHIASVEDLGELRDLHLVALAHHAAHEVLVVEDARGGAPKHTNHKVVQVELDEIEEQRLEQLEHRGAVRDLVAAQPKVPALVQLSDVVLGLGLGFGEEQRGERLHVDAHLVDEGHVVGGAVLHPLNAVHKVHEAVQHRHKGQPRQQLMPRKLRMRRQLRLERRQKLVHFLQNAQNVPKVRLSCWIGTSANDASSRSETHTDL